MSSTGRLGLPYIVTSQAQKEVTHNEALNRLDAFVTPIIIDIVTAPPGSPTMGDLYIVRPLHKEDIYQNEVIFWIF
jgi:hypothetical protein